MVIVLKMMINMMTTTRTSFLHTLLREITATMTMMEEVVGHFAMVVTTWGILRWL